MPKEQLEVTYTGPDEIRNIIVRDRRNVEVFYFSGRVVKYFYNRVVSEDTGVERPIHIHLGGEE